MHAANRERIYTETIHTRVTPEVMIAVQEASAASGLKPCAWLRKVIANGLRGDMGQRVVLAELMALRTVFLTLQRGEWRAAEFTDEQLSELVKAVEARKFAQADARILAAKNQ